MTCPQCEQENAPQGKFCPECGARRGAHASQSGTYANLQAENEHLKRSLAAALEQQTITADILRAISVSPTALQTVLDTVAAAASRLCEAANVSVYQVVGSQMRKVAQHGPQITALPLGGTRPITRGSVSGRAILERATIRVHDQQAPETRREFPDGARQDTGIRTTVGIPLLREEGAIGAFTVYRTEPRPFSDAEVALLQIFADQAAIAIQNARLFKELAARNAALTEALDQQTATSEILKVIASSPTDLQPVLDAMAESAARLCASYDASIFRLDDGVLHSVAHHGPLPDRPGLVIPAIRGTVTGRSVIDRETVSVADLQEAGDEFPQGIVFAREFGFRSYVSVPLLRQGIAIGAIGLRRTEVQPFTETQIALLQTFADQAVIAIENVRLFKELETSNREIAEKSRQIEVASQHKSEFLANMSHELRTPLNAIIGFSEVLSERMFGELNEKQEEYLKDIHASGQHLLSLINDILDLSKIEAGRMELELTDFHLPAALDNALTLVRERAGRRGIALHAAIDDRIEYIGGDERKIKQVLLNLLSNALKFTLEGGRVEVRAGLRDEVVEVSVRDTGIGIAPEDHEAIFEEFRQVGSASKKIEGTGLGLSLSRKFVELHGGRIWVDSHVGAGSTFTFTIPLHRCE